MNHNAVGSWRAHNNYCICAPLASLRPVRSLAHRPTCPRQKHGQELEWHEPSQARIQTKTTDTEEHQAWARYNSQSKATSQAPTSATTATIFHFRINHLAGGFALQDQLRKGERCGSCRFLKKSAGVAVFFRNRQLPHRSPA